MPAELSTERRGATLLLTLADPATRNRLSEQLVAAAIEALNVAESDPGVRCVVLRGAGTDFCAGAAELEPPGAPIAETAAARWRETEQIVQLVEAMRAFPRPVIAAVEGIVAGAGLALVLACDLVVAAENVRFTRPGTQAGGGADGAAQALFADALPRALAMQWLCLADEPAFVRQLQACGVLNRVCAPGQALAAACTWAEELAAVSDAVLGGAKALLDASPRPALARQLAAARDRLAAGLLRGL
ncbi:MAG: enoyl-CoA hydratase/isomerase family protein [Ideonella sp.]|nr:enoyl-CoA hydratase/isomerase family protein [Ideonella sp.]